LANARGVGAVCVMFEKSLARLDTGGSVAEAIEGFDDSNLGILGEKATARVRERETECFQCPPRVTQVIEAYAPKFERRQSRTRITWVPVAKLRVRSSGFCWVATETCGIRPRHQLNG